MCTAKRGRSARVIGKQWYNNPYELEKSGVKTLSVMELFIFFLDGKHGGSVKVPSHISDVVRQHDIIDLMRALLSLFPL